MCYGGTAGRTFSCLDTRCEQLDVAESNFRHTAVIITVVKGNNDQCPSLTSVTVLCEITLNFSDMTSTYCNET